MAQNVTAPMVGKVFQIQCKVGDKVEEEQVLIVLEAMKMEIPVESPAAGTVKEIKVAIGDTVEPDTVLTVLV